MPGLPDASGIEGLRRTALDASSRSEAVRVLMLGDGDPAS